MKAFAVIAIALLAMAAAANAQEPRRQDQALDTMAMNEPQEVPASVGDDPAAGDATPGAYGYGGATGGYGGESPSPQLLPDNSPAPRDASIPVVVATPPAQGAAGSATAGIISLVAVAAAVLAMF